MLNGFGDRGNFIFFPNIVFGSLTSTFVIAYIILWIVLPEARSSYEKMEMRGEKVDVNTIKQNVQDRAKEMGEDIKSAAQNFSAKAKEFSQTSGKTFATEVKQVSRPIGSGIGRAIEYYLKCSFFLLQVQLICIVCCPNGNNFRGVATWPFNDYLWTNGNPYLHGDIDPVSGIPLIGFIVWLIRRIIEYQKQLSRLDLCGLWTLGWVSVIMLIAVVRNPLF
jgi:hypothetical protein